MLVSIDTAIMQGRSLLNRFRRHTRGAAAVEFAFLAPLLLLMLLATIETGRAINIDRQFTSATGMAGDLVAREEYLGDTTTTAKANLDSMMLSIKHIMQPYDASSLKLGAFSVRASSTDATDTRVEWTYSYNGKSVPAKCEKYALPANLVGKGESVIVVDSTFVFKPLFGNYVPGITGDMTWTGKSYHTPRNSCVDYVKGNNCVSSC